MDVVDAAAEGGGMPLLDVRDVSIFFRGNDGEAQATSDISFAVRRGERVGVVRESGCGKTVTGLSILGLLPPASARVTGEILFHGEDLLKARPAASSRSRASCAARWPRRCLRSRCARATPTGCRRRRSCGTTDSRPSASTCSRSSGC